MRTTLAIDDDVLAAARAIAEHRGRSLGEVLSDLARRSLLPEQAVAVRNGIALFPMRPDARPVTLELIQRLNEELP